MIGNDIVDFESAAKASDWTRNGWLEKMFAAKEQELIGLSSRPDRFVWILWSMKEASYKAHQRRYQLTPKFNPRSYVCIVDPKDEHRARITAKVCIEDQYYPIISEVSRQYVHSLARASDLDIKISIYKVCRIPNSLELRSMLLHQLYGSENHKYSIQKNALGIPDIYDSNGGLAAFWVSMSHHGNFGAYVVKGYLS